MLGLVRSGALMEARGVPDQRLVGVRAALPQLTPFMSSPVTLVLPPPPPAAFLPKAPGDGSPPRFAIEPSIDDLAQDLSQLRSDVSDITASIEDIRLLREQLVSSVQDASFSETAHPRKQLSSLTTLTGDRILRVSTPLADLATKVEIVAGLVQEGRAAATTLEIGIVKEELEAVKLDIKEAMQGVVEEAEHEQRLLSESKERWQAIIVKENPTLSAEGVRVSLNDAVRGLESKVAELDPSSYAGQFAIEHPFNELSKLISVATDVHRSASQASQRSGSSLQRMATHSSLGSTLVGTDYYSKEDADDVPGDVESQLLRSETGRLAKISGASKVDKIVYKVLSDENAVKYDKFVAYMRVHWRDVLLRSSLALIVLGGIAGLIAWQAIERQHQVEKDLHPSISSAELGPPVTVNGLFGGHTLA
ncbi:hypothetical protein OIV83_000700 [Microbotryomycetes sp. JL201]|nr:hypothetical protein OIV83_000700 [Microbotryomycetes sp. JL201]